jgi:hypothetical protein
MKKKLLIAALLVLLLAASLTLVAAAAIAQKGSVACNIYLPAEFGGLTYTENGHWIYYPDKGVVIVKCFGSLPQGIQPPEVEVSYSAGTYPWLGSPCGPVYTRDWSTTIYPDGSVDLKAKWRCEQPPSPYPPPPTEPPPPYPPPPTEPPPPYPYP